MSKIDYDEEAEELIREISPFKYRFISEEEIKKVAERLKKMYNYGVGYKRDRAFLSKEKHEKKYAPKRKTLAKAYKKK